MNHLNNLSEKNNRTKGSFLSFDSLTPMPRQQRTRMMYDRIPGFMLIEVILAITLLGIAAVPLLNLQSNLIKNVWMAQDYVDRIWILQNLFSQPEIHKLTKSSYTGARYFLQKNTVDFYDLKYECLPINNKSELANHFPDLYITHSRGSWNALGGDYDEQIVSLVYIAPVSEKPASEKELKA